MRYSESAAPLESWYDGQALRLPDELRSKAQHQPLADVGLHELVGERLELSEGCDREEQADRGGEEGGSGSRDGRRQQRLKGWGERTRPEDRVDHDLEGHGVQERDGTRQQPDAEQDGEVEPVGPRLAQQSPVQGEIAHKASLRRSRSTISRIVAVAALHCSSARAANRSAPKPSRATATQA